MAYTRDPVHLEFLGQLLNNKHERGWMLPETSSQNTRRSIMPGSVPRPQGLLPAKKPREQSKEDPKEKKTKHL